MNTNNQIKKSLYILICLSIYILTPALAEDRVTKLPGVMVNHDQQYVDVSAKVVLRDGDWLELLLCTPGTREHESILTTTAKPSHIHLAMVMLGLEPGHPMTGKKVGDTLEVTPASGPLVAVSLHYTLEDKAITIPANLWVYDKNTKQDLPDNHWLFAGSSFIKTNDQTIYRADTNGSVITLVHFGDDLLARKTKLTSHNDNARWQARTEKIPPVGTPVTLRLKPVILPPSPDQKTDKPHHKQ